MLFCFFSLSLCSHIFPYPVLTLTDANFPGIIDKRLPGSVFFVMFHGERCPACQMSYSALQNAATKSSELVNFCHVDCSANPKLAQRFQIMSIPTFMIFHDGETINYNGPRTPHDFIVAASKCIPDKTEKITKSNFQDFKKGVILFDKKKKVPALWRSMSANLTNHGVRVGYSHDESLAESINPDDERFIAYVNQNGESEVLNLANKFSEVYETVSKLFGITPKPTPTPKPLPGSKNQKPTETEFETFSDFNKLCKTTPYMCIVEMNEKASEDFLAIKKKFQKDKFLFLNCKNPDLFQNLPKGVIIFHSKRNAYISSDNYEEVAQNIERIVDGSAKWNKMDPIQTDL